MRGLAAEMRVDHPAGEALHQAANENTELKISIKNLKNLKELKI